MSCEDLAVKVIVSKELQMKEGVSHAEGGRSCHQPKEEQVPRPWDRSVPSKFEKVQELVRLEGMIV